jgi:hypothetical protein
MEDTKTNNEWINEIKANIIHLDYIILNHL